MYIFVNNKYVFLDLEDNQFVPAGFWRRSFATLIDFLIVWVVFTAIDDFLPIEGKIATEIVRGIFIVGYFIFLHRYNHGQTLGKQLMQIAVITPKGDRKRLSWLQSIFRTVMTMLIFQILIDVFNMNFFDYVLKVFIVVNVLFLFITRHNRTLLDYVFNTYVVELYELDIVDLDNN